MKDVAGLLNAMRDAGVISDDALFGAVAQMRYTEAVALDAGRAKDMARVLALLESGAVSPEDVEDLARRHHLQDAWTRFRSRFLDERD